MKYAILGPRHGINRVRDTAPVSDGIHFVEISDDQAESITTMLAERQMPIWLDGEVVSRRSEVEAGNRIQWDEAAGKLVRVARLVPPYDQLRRHAYIEAGATTEALAVALWEKEEGRPAEWDRIQSLREAIKAEYPKP